MDAVHLWRGLVRERHLAEKTMPVEVEACRDGNPSRHGSGQVEDPCLTFVFHDLAEARNLNFQILENLNLAT